MCDTYSQEVTEFAKFLMCSNTGKIFKNPIIDDNGIIHESDEINFNSSNMNSSTSFYRVLPLISFINSFLEKYPEYKQLQYKPSNSKKNHSNNIDNVNSILHIGLYNFLTQFSNFSIKLINEVYFLNFLSKAKFIQFKYFFDNLADKNELSELTFRSGFGKYYVINYICSLRIRDPQIVKYIINIGDQMKLNCGIFPLTSLVKNTVYDDLIKYAITKHCEENLDLYVGSTLLIHDILRYQSVEIINFALDLIDKNDEKFKIVYQTISSTLKKNGNVSRTMFEIITTKYFAQEEKEEKQGKDEK